MPRPTENWKLDPSRDVLQVTAIDRELKFYEPVYTCFLEYKGFNMGKVKISNHQFKRWSDRIPIILNEKNFL